MKNVTKNVTSNRTKPEITIEANSNVVDDTVYYNSKVIPTIIENNIDTITLIKDGEEISYNMGEEIGEDGSYVLTVVDKATNTSSVEFVIDTTIPGLSNIYNGKIVEGGTIEASDTNFYYMTIKNLMTKEEKTVYEDTYTLPDIAADNTIYDIYVYDKAMNKSERVRIYHDNQDPVITGTGLIGEDNKTIENNGTYKSVSLKISDGSLKSVVSVSGSDETILEEYSDNYTDQKIVYENTFTEDGTYTIKAIDRVGRESVITFTIDKTPASIKASNILVSGDPNEQEGGIYYAKIGDVIEAYVRFSEELNSIPTFTLHNNGNEYVIDSEDVIVNENDAGEFTYKILYEIKEDTKMTDGQITFTVSDIYDCVLNKTDDVTDVTNGHKVFLDISKPTAKYVAILNNTPYKDGDYNYITNGDVVRVLIELDEQIYIPENLDESSFVLKINGDETKFMRSGDTKHGDGSEKYEYIAQYTIPEDEAELAEGEITFEISGFTDLAGNIGDSITKPNHTQFNSLIYDKNAPVFEGANKTMESDVTINVNDVSLDKIVVTDKTNNTTTEVENGYVLSNEGFYKIVAYDKFDRSTTWNLTIDNNAPIITIENAKENNYYNGGVIINIDDLEVNQVYLNDERMGRINTLTVNEEGTYTVWAKDNFGHESEKVTFTIDKTPIEVKEGSVTIFNRTNYENGNYKYAKNGDKLSILVTFTEEAYIPENLDESSFVLKINGDEVKFVRSQDTKYSDGSEKYEYIAQYTIPEDEAELTEGEITFEISGFTDLAGNTNAVINNDDNKKYNSVIYDRTPALTNDDSNPLYILNVSDSSRRKYIKDGQTLRVEANFNEMLVENPILTIGDKQSSTFKYRGSKDGKYTYVADITIDNEKANLKNEEIIPFTITNIIDVAGNESTLNNDNVTVAGNYGQVIYDNSVGEVTFSSNGGSTVAKEFVVTVDVKEKYIDKIYYMFTTKSKKDDVIKKFNNNEGIEITNHDSGKFTVSKTNATNNYFLWVKVVDMAGNVSYTRTRNKFKLDNTYPDVKITTSNNGQPTKKDVTVTLKANEEIKELDGWTKVDDKTYTKVYSENYSGSIYVEDKIGNGVNVDYAVTGIDKVSPTMTVVDKNRYYIEAGSEYVDKGYSAIDDVEGDITSRVEKTYQFQKRGSNNWEVVPTIDTKNVGTYKITYTISDLAGNSAKDDRVVAIKDETAPVISINTLVKLKVGDKFIEDIYDNISDNSSDTLKVEIYPGTPILDTTTKGVYSINYKVSDGAGNYDVETRKIIVE